MNPSRQPKLPLETELGRLALHFRSTSDESEREQVAADYEHIVDPLSANWR